VSAAVSTLLLTRAYYWLMIFPAEALGFCPPAMSSNFLGESTCR